MLRSICTTKEDILGLVFILILAACSSPSLLKKPKNSYTSEDIAMIAERRFNFDLKTQMICEVYILDGITYDQTQIDSILSIYDTDDIRMINFLVYSEEYTWWNKECDLFPLIQTKLSKQKRSYQKEVIDRISKIYRKFDQQIKFSENICGYCPIVIIDKERIDNPVEALERLTKLKLSQIEFIADYQTAHNPAYYGAKAKNGVVEIFTTKRRLIN